jgi:hypothetical protein
VPILPIDLQTIFMQIGNVGKEQAAAREVAPLQQSLQATEIVKQTYQQDRSVNETRDEREGQRIAEEERRRQARGGEGGKRGPAGEQDAGERKPDREEVFRDPALGSHIDVVR